MYGLRTELQKYRIGKQLTVKRYNLSTKEVQHENTAAMYKRVHGRP